MAAIKDWPIPQTAHQVRQFLGLASFYRRYIQGFAQLAAPLSELLKEADVDLRTPVLQTGTWRVRQNLWPYISVAVTRTFTASLNLGHYPQRWKTAKIVVLRKPGKADYTVPSSYRPISLLNTLGKLLEAVVARRLSYYAEKYKLLPDTQFGGRPGRTTEQALLILANPIDQAWLRNSAVTLKAFDLKGAFNGVNKFSLDARLRERGIPTCAREWIRSFMQDRMANIQLGDFQTEVGSLANAGLACSEIQHAC